MISAIALILLVVIPPLIKQAASLNLDFQRIMQEVEGLLAQQVYILGRTVNVSEIFQRGVTTLVTAIEPAIGQTLSIAVDVITSIVWTVFVVVIAFYLVKDGDSFSAWVDSLVPSGYEYDFSKIKDELGKIWRSFFLGQMTLALVVAGIWGATLSSALGGRPASGPPRDGAGDTLRRGGAGPRRAGLRRAGGFPRGTGSPGGLAAGVAAPSGSRSADGAAFGGAVPQGGAEKRGNGSPRRAVVGVPGLGCVGIRVGGAGIRFNANFRDGKHPGSSKTQGAGPIRYRAGGAGAVRANVLRLGERALTITGTNGTRMKRMARITRKKFVLFVSFANFRVTKLVPRALAEIQANLSNRAQPCGRGRTGWQSTACPPG